MRSTKAQSTCHAEFIESKTSCLSFFNNYIICGSYDQRINTLSLFSIEICNVGSELNSHAIIDIESDATIIKCLPDVEKAVCALSNGSVSLFSVNPKLIENDMTFTSLHNGSIPSMILRLPELITFGEDCKMCFIRLDHQQHKVIENFDCCTINTSVLIGSNTVATGNSIGQLKLWDFRTSYERPVKVLSTSNKKLSVECMDVKPDEPDILATGNCEGQLGIWDLRNENSPVTLHEAHSSNVWDVAFHDIDCNTVFTCSEDGEIWQWNCINSPAYASVLDKSSALSTGWLSNPKSCVEVESLVPSTFKMPVNCLDIRDNVLVAGTDNESIYIISPIVV